MARIQLEISCGISPKYEYLDLYSNDAYHSGTEIPRGRHVINEIRTRHSETAVVVAGPWSHFIMGANFVVTELTIAGISFVFLF